MQIEFTEDFTNVAKKKIKFLQDAGAKCCEVVLRQPNGSEAHVDSWGKVTWDDSHSEMKRDLPCKFEDDGCDKVLPPLDEELAEKVWKATKECRACERVLDRLKGRSYICKNRCDLPQTPTERGEG